MLSHYKLRVDLTKGDTGERKVIDNNLVLEMNVFECQNMVGFMRCTEGLPDNPHYHYYFQSTKRPPVLRKALRGMGLKGNGMYSLKEVDAEEPPLEYLAYMMKEDYEYVVRNLPQSLMDEAVKYQKKMKSEYAEKVKARKEAQKSQVQKIRSYVANKYCMCPKEDKDSSGDCKDFQCFRMRLHHAVGETLRKDVARYMVEYFISKNKLVSEGLVRNYYRTFMCYFSPSYTDLVISRIISED